MTSSWQEVLETGKESLSAFTRKDFEAVAQFYAEDCVLFYPKYGRMEGRKAAAQAQYLFPEVQADFKRVCSEATDDRVIEIQSYSNNGTTMWGMLVWGKRNGKWQIKHEMCCAK